MSSTFSTYEINLLNANRIPNYPDSNSLEKYLLSEKNTNNSTFTIAKLTTTNGIFTLPITSRTYRGILIHELYHSEFFKSQYSLLGNILSVEDLRDPSVKWKPTYNINSRVVLPLSYNQAESLFNNSNQIKRYLKKYPLNICKSINGEMVSATMDRFNIENLGSTTSECLEYDTYITGRDLTRKYFSLASNTGIHKSIVELQILVKNNTLILYYINTYYIKDLQNKTERVGLNSYYTVVKLAATIAKELGHKNFIIDFGIIFKFHYKLQIPNSFLSGTTLTFTK